MSLYEKLQKATSEEDVKDAYIKALGLKNYSKNLIDLQTKEIWFEAKDTKRNSTYAMFTQLMHYVQAALNKGEYIPPFLAVIDTEKAAIMKSSDVIPFLAKKTIKWGKSASQYTQEALDEISTHIGTHFVSFKISTHEEEFISTVKEAIKSGDIIRTNITPDNLKQVFDKWVSMIGREIKEVDEKDYALLFYADIMHDGVMATHSNLTAQLLHKNDAPVFSLNGHLYELGNKEGYRQFWAIYQKPPKEEYRNYLLERRDSLIPLDERVYKGGYYTPLNVVDKAYDKLTETLGKNWQKDYIVWDMCCGVGNLEVKHSNHRNIFMSTLDMADVDIMQATKTCVAAQRFQYDYLNDDITDNGQIDYTLTNKVPSSLLKAIKEEKKILVLINPPYAESTSSDNINTGGASDSSKTGIAKTKLAQSAMSEYGKASNELFTQFVVRIAKEMPNATLAMFSTMKYVNSQTLEIFRSVWNAKYLDGFVVHSKTFDGLKGDFPIGFLIWKTDQKSKTKQPIVEISTEVLDRHVNPIGEKCFYNISNDLLLTNWIKRPKTNETEVIPLKNAITPATANKDLRGTKWSKDALAFCWCNGNDVQQASRTALFSSGFNGGHGLFVNPENLWQVAIMFSVRQLVKHTWVNHNDQFLIPTEPLSYEFKTDCLIFMLFHGKNLSASANDLKWNDKKWSIVNHFIPFTEVEVNSPGRFESDFMVQYLADKELSPEAKTVLDGGRKLWQSYFSETDVRSVRDKYCLNRTDVGWYQVRKALEERNASGDFIPVSFKPLEEAYKNLTDKLNPQVYELGFLRK
ncbi:MAG TPA: hypothetical protein PLK90_08345 [Clostridiales bacterium]|nr:hypothetical protein [Clostridiales bacterium]HQP70391.1 hypothetical protein [Clostridiales bacterium]